MIRVYFYTAWDAGWRRLRFALDVLQQGLWLGLLDYRHLDELGSIQYARWAHYREKEYNLSGLRPWEIEVVKTYYRSGSSILIAAAGGGREPIALARMGYRVDGFDSTPELAESCRRLMNREKLQGKVLLARAGNVPEDIDPQYDGLIIGWGGYMHIPGRSNRITFLSALRRHVPVEAPLLLSFFCRREGSRRDRWILAIASRVRKLRRSTDPVEYGDTLASTFDHCFTEAEIRAELAESGFKLIDYRETPYGHAIGRAV